MENKAPRQVPPARWMGEALTLAREMQGFVWPNPPVGCVIVREGGIVGRGQTQFGGRPHAERIALEEAGDRACGASLYVTLEPCCHWGRTPPCAPAIIAAGVKEVYASLQDPDPRVNGGGFRALRAAGIAVDIGLAAREARAIMAGFFHRVATGQPLVTIGAIPAYRNAIPKGFDALVRSDADRLWILTRGRETDIVNDSMEMPDSTEDLLDELGKYGLTSVYVSQDDFLTSAFSAILREGRLHERV